MSGESLTFISQDAEPSQWQELLLSYAETSEVPAAEIHNPPRFVVHIQDSSIWFEVELPFSYPSTPPIVLVRGDEISRSEHERWQAIVKGHLSEVSNSEYVPCVTRSKPSC